mmetsp:Transcript_13500/g.21348  ORF Transcript_13500/g.21348 Transcript_13500/m.21348 type:complete len:93 (+) Transcript_13500:541-819(+)
MNSFGVQSISLPHPASLPAPLCPLPPSQHRSRQTTSQNRIAVVTGTQYTINLKECTIQSRIVLQYHRVAKGGILTLPLFLRILRFLQHRLLL